jgi:hypothetical protein
MEVKYNVTGSRRKELVGAISEITDFPVSYAGAPTFSYEIGGFTVDKSGTLSFGNETNSGLVEKLMEKLSERGFELPDENSKLTIEMPMEGFTENSLTNLERMIASKAGLIKKAIGIEALPVERLETTIKFPWFSSEATGDEVFAYSHFITALCTAAKEQSRVTAKEQPVENEKFAFRVFLIRLGFVGKEYKMARKILLQNLSGNSAFKNGRPKTEVSADE